MTLEEAPDGPDRTLLAEARRRLDGTACVQGLGLGRNQDGQPLVVILVDGERCRESLAPLLQGLAWKAVVTGKLERLGSPDERAEPS